MAWVYLLIASVFEVIWAIALKYAHGFTRFMPSIICIVGMVFSVVFLALAVKKLPIGTAYAVWTGIGAALTAVGGIVLLGESNEPARLFFIGMIVAGVVGLKIASPSM
jgi:quaternary ammonium compound-resistance protein SugE